MTNKGAIFRNLPARITLIFLVSVTLMLPAVSHGQVSSILVRADGGKRAQVLTRSGMVDLQSLIEAFDLRSSLDILGERLDIVGGSGSCRLLLESPLILSRGLFTVMSGPLVNNDGRLYMPVDFLLKALPTLTGRSVTLNQQVLTMGREGSGRFNGRGADELTRYAAFIRKDQYVPEKALQTEPRGLKVVVLDPGHGGRSIGAQGATGTREKDIALNVAEKLKTRLEEGLGIKVVLTRTADYYVGLKERTAIGNNNRADLFLSIHANATFRRDITGYETYYLNMKSTNDQARELAEAENKALGVKGGQNDKVLLEAILWDMAQTAYINESSELAGVVQKRLVSELRGRDRGVHQAPLAVLMGARMPAALVEIGYISNPEQELRLNRDAHQNEIARALYLAIEEYHRSLLQGGVGRSQR
ncbi:MAG: N-acetylmuramoyl-L-alanine amidase [Pseudomonadota bacterium]|jgi:N-acetylmuramoyl-L-alanine amidase